MAKPIQYCKVKKKKKKRKKGTNNRINRQTSKMHSGRRVTVSFWTIGTTRTEI